MSILYKLTAIIAALFINVAIASAQTDNSAIEEPVGAEFDPSIAAENGYDVTQDKEGNYVVKSETSAIVDSILELFKLFIFNLAISFIVVQFFYFKKSKRMDYYFTFLIFSSAMFLLLFVMKNISLQIGFTIGLFAIFGMIRYRTETVPVREMTYLFIIIAISIINGIGANIPFAELVAANVLILLLIWALEFKGTVGKHHSTKLVIYDKIELIVPERRKELIADLESRIGVKIEDIEIGQVDFLKDSAWIKVFYVLEKGKSNSIDSLDKPSHFVSE